MVVTPALDAFQMGLSLSWSERQFEDEPKTAHHGLRDGSTAGCHAVQLWMVQNLGWEFASGMLMANLGSVQW